MAAAARQAAVLAAGSAALGRALTGAELVRDSDWTVVLMRHRWQVLAGELEADGEFPAISAMARALLAATAGWDGDELPLYPALR
jgi:hypothetical protein